MNRLLLSALVFLFSAAASTSAVQPTEADCVKALRDKLAEAGKSLGDVPAESPPRPDPAKPTSFSEVIMGDSIVKYATKHYERIAVFDKWVLDDTTGVLFPGALVWTKPLAEESRLDLLPVMEGLSQASIVMPNVRRSGDVADPNFRFIRSSAHYQHALNNLLRSVESVPTRIIVKRSEATTIDEALQDFGMSARYWKARLKGSVREQKTQNRAFVVVSVDQVFWDVRLDSADDMKATLDTVACDPVWGPWLMQEITKRGAPAVVDSIQYGRRAIFTVSAECSQDELTRALTFSLNAPGFGLDAGFLDRAKQIYTTMDIQGTVVGGRYDENVFMAVLGAREQFLDRLSAFFAATGKFDELTAAVPLQFTVKGLDGSVLKVADTAQFSSVVEAGRYCSAQQRRVESQMVETNPENAKRTHGDDDIHSDDFTGVEIGYKIYVSDDRRRVLMDINWFARELEDDKSWKPNKNKRTQFVSNRTVTLFDLGAACPRARILDVPDIQLNANNRHDHGKGERHGPQNHPEFGGLSNIKVEFDGKGNDNDKQRLRATVAPFTVKIDREYD